MDFSIYIIRNTIHIIEEKMASTRNKNTPGNYALEKHAYQKGNSMLLYAHAPQGNAYQTNLPGDGLLPGRIAASNLSHNSCNVESYLFGIGSTNLENPQTPLKYQPKSVDSLHMINKTPMVMPEPFGILPNQRPMYLN
jgi:hypothetical protein